MSKSSEFLKELDKKSLIENEKKAVLDKFNVMVASRVTSAGSLARVGSAKFSVASSPETDGVEETEWDDY